MRNHDIHRCKIKPRQHRHEVAPALAFHHAFIAGHGTVSRLQTRLSAAGRDDQAQGFGQVIMAHLGHLGYLFADHCMICLRSNVVVRSCCVVAEKYQKLLFTELPLS